MSAPSPSPERRRNLLTGDWVLVSPQRLQRPWQGGVDAPAPPQGPSYDAACYLCPGNTRAAGPVNPAYRGVYVFDNDYPALLPDPQAPADADTVFERAPEWGRCRVICYSPDHALTLSRLPPSRVREIVDAWALETERFAADPDIKAVTIFENRGEMMGASNPHPHGQIWATSSVPNELAREDARQAEWFAREGRPLLQVYAERELAAETRVVLQNDQFVAVVPFWAAWPFETLVLPLQSVSGLDRLSDAARTGLADLLSRLTQGYDRLFETPFPYTMGIHQRPLRIPDDRHFTAHVHFYPPLLRSATIRKFMVGFEMMAMPQRDLTPEAAAARLRAVAA